MTRVPFGSMRLGACYDKCTGKTWVLLRGGYTFRWFP
jgi:hypothetical protein